MRILGTMIFFPVVLFVTTMDWCYGDKFTVAWKREMNWLLSVYGF